MMTTTVNKNGSFALTTSGVVERQNKKNEDKFGSTLVPLNILTGSRTVPEEAPPSKRACKARKEGKEKKEFKISGGFKKFTGQACGASRDKVKEYIATCLKQANEVDSEYKAQQIAYTILLAVNKRDIDDGAGERDLSYWMFLELYHEFPETMKKVLVPFVAKYGSFLDLNKIACINHKDISAGGERSENAKKLQDEIIALYCSILEKGKAAIEAYLDKPEVKEEPQQASSNAPDTVYLSAAKWAPRIDKRDDRICGLGKAIARQLYGYSEKSNAAAQKKEQCRVEKLYRQKLAAILKEFPTIETKMCGSGDKKAFEMIADNPRGHLKSCPGKAMNKYKKALLDEYKYGEKKGQRRHEGEEIRTKVREELLKMTEEVLKDPEAAKDLIKGGKTLQPHELVASLMGGGESDPVKEAQWKMIVQHVKDMGSLDETVVMSDVSGSMSGIPMQVSIALGLIIAAVQTGEAWKNRILTFDSTPVWHVVDPEKTLKEQVTSLQNAPWGGSTDLQKAIDLVIQVAKAAGIPTAKNASPDDDLKMPKQFIILTDMCFDAAIGSYGNDDELSAKSLTHVEILKKKFVDAGYEPPVIILWNIRSNDVSFQNKSDDVGVVNLAGFSVALLKSILEGDELDLAKMTPCQLICQVLEKPRYKVIHDILKEANEGDLRGYDKVLERVAREKAAKEAEKKKAEDFDFGKEEEAMKQ